MNIGVSVYGLAPDDTVELAIAAEENGFDAVWLGEHMFSIDYGSARAASYGSAHTQASRTSSVAPPAMHFADPWIAMGAIASATTRLRIATGVIVLPLRHPLLVAHQAATLDALSHGRFLLGVGAGWMKEEFDAMDMPFENRGARMDEAVEILRLAQNGNRFSYEGEQFRFKELQISPVPCRYPLVIGGNSGRALRRAAEFGDAWYTSGSPVFEDALKMRDALFAQRDRLGRSGEFRCYVRVGELNPSVVEKYAAEGVENLVIWSNAVWPSDKDLEGKRAAMAEAARMYGLR